MRIIINRNERSALFQTIGDELDKYIDDSDLVDSIAKKIIDDILDILELEE